MHLKSGYIQLVYQNPLKFENQPLKFYKLSLNTGFVWDADYPLLNYERIPHSVLSSFSIDIIDLMIHAINNNKYPMLYIDEFYLPYRAQYQETHLIHENLFYGYDEEKETMNVLAYVTENGRYSFRPFEVSFSFVREAYLNSLLEYNGELKDSVILLSNKKEKIFI